MLLSAVALLGVVMLSAGARSVLAATLSDENDVSRGERSPSFARAERRDAKSASSVREAAEIDTAVTERPPFAVSESAGVRALDVSARGLERARVADAEADAMVRAATAAATAAAAKAKAFQPSEARAFESAASTEPEVVSEVESVESAADDDDDDDDDSARQPRVTDDMTYEEKQAEFARFAKAEAERNDRIAAEAAERERANAAGEETGEAEPAEPTEEAEEAESTEEAALPEETDSTSWPLVGAGQRLIVNVPDDVTQDATAEIVTGE